MLQQIRARTGTSDAAHIDWMNNANTFCSTVDCIVPGRIRDLKEMAALEEANHTDKALDVGEVFGVLGQRALQVWRTSRSRRPASTWAVVPDVTPCQRAKVRIQRCPHRLVCWAHIWQASTSCDCMHNDTVWRPL